MPPWLKDLTDFLRKFNYFCGGGVRIGIALRFFRIIVTYPFIILHCKPQHPSREVRLHDGNSAKEIGSACLVLRGSNNLKSLAKLLKKINQRALVSLFSLRAAIVSKLGLINKMFKGIRIEGFSGHPCNNILIFFREL